MDWIDLVQDRGRRRALVNALMNIWGFIRCGQLLSARVTAGFIRTLFHGISQRAKVETEEVPISIILTWFTIEIHTSQLQGLFLMGDIGSVGSVEFWTVGE